MTRLLLAGALLLVACGARTELDPFGPDGSVTSDAGVDAARPDAARADVGAPGPGVTIALFSGDTRSDGTTWGRPYSCSDSSNGEVHFYSVVTFENPTSQDLRVEVLVDWSFDGFLHVYESPFDPRQTRTRCLGADDDFNGTSQSRVEGIFVPAGESIDLVLSSYSPGSAGSYDAFVITQ